jgi:uncharacterized protein Smg (DUF494 family)
MAAPEVVGLEDKLSCNAKSKSWRDYKEEEDDNAVVNVDWNMHLLVFLEDKGSVSFGLRLVVIDRARTPS